MLGGHQHERERERERERELAHASFFLHKEVGSSALLVKGKRANVCQCWRFRSHCNCARFSSALRAPLRRMMTPMDNAPDWTCPPLFLPLRWTGRVEHPNNYPSLVDWAFSIQNKLSNVNNQNQIYLFIFLHSSSLWTLKKCQHIVTTTHGKFDSVRRPWLRTLHQLMQIIRFHYKNDYINTNN